MNAENTTLEHSNNRELSNQAITYFSVGIHKIETLDRVGDALIAGDTVSIDAESSTDREGAVGLQRDWRESIRVDYPNQLLPSGSSLDSHRGLLFVWVYLHQLVEVLEL